MPDDRTKPLRSARARSTTPLVLGAFARGLARRWRFAAPAAFAALMFLMPSAHAGDCPSDQTFFKVPEIVARDGVLRGTLQLTDAQVWMRTRFPPQGETKAVPPGTKDAIYNCFAQNVRAFRIFPDQPLPAVVGQTLPDPFPGPTLRARVGDIVELTFINQLDPARFGRTGDMRCDVVTNVYPGPDKFPDCFHGSSTGNIHFHGTHTNPNGTADNVLLEVAASPRDANNKPTITPDTYSKQFDTFFAECQKHLRDNQLEEWPRNWNGSNDPGGSSLGPWYRPGTWTATQMELLPDAETGKNEKVAMKNRWPQYYIGAYPYCFQIPFYTASSFPPPPGSLQMGQAPGTHWYHAHKHGSTAIDVANGMVGAFIIEGPSYDDELNRFYGPGWTRTQPTMVINQTGVAPNMMRARGPARQDKGPDLVVNGRFASIIDMAPGEVQMWRIVNGSGRSGVFIDGSNSFIDASNAPAGFHYRRIAQDGVQLADVNYQRGEDKPLLLASGNRADLLVMAPKTPGIYRLMVQHEVDPSDLTGKNPAIPVVLLQIRVNKDLPPVTGHRLEFIPAMPKPPEFPAFLTNITTREANAPRTVPPGCNPLNRASSSPCGKHGQQSAPRRILDRAAHRPQDRLARLTAHDRRPAVQREPGRCQDRHAEHGRGMAGREHVDRPEYRTRRPSVPHPCQSVPARRHFRSERDRRRKGQDPPKIHHNTGRLECTVPDQAGRQAHVVRLSQQPGRRPSAPYLVGMSSHSVGQPVDHGQRTRILGALARALPHAQPLRGLPGRVRHPLSYPCA